MVPMQYISGEDDLRDVFREVLTLEARYYLFGTELGLPPQELDTIRMTYAQDISQAFSEVLLTWLRQRYNTDKYGPPTWQRLVVAVDSHAGGNNHALAKIIASNHPRGNL